MGGAHVLCGVGGVAGWQGKKGAVERWRRWAVFLEACSITLNDSCSDRCLIMCLVGRHAPRS